MDLIIRELISQLILTMKDEDVIEINEKISKRVNLVNGLDLEICYSTLKLYKYSLMNIGIRAFLKTASDRKAPISYKKAREYAENCIKKGTGPSLVVKSRGILKLIEDLDEDFFMKDASNTFWLWSKQ